MKRQMAHPEEPVPELGWQLVFACVLVTILVWALAVGVLAIGGGS